MRIMKIAINPPLDDLRLAKLREAAAPAEVVNAPEVEDADAFLGKITPPLLARARKLRWVQSFTVSLEHYLFPELVAHPCVLTNMRGLFSDVVADHAIGLVLCFARNLHLYVRRQLEARWAPVGGEGDRPSMAAGPGTVAGFDRAHVHLADATLGVVGMGGIGSEVARRATAFGMRVLGHDPKAPGGALEVLLAESDYVVIAAPHTPSTAGLFDRATIRKMKPTAVLINVGRGAIVRLDDLTAALEAGEIAGAPGERDPHAARRGGLGADRRAPPGRAAGQRPPLRPRRAPRQRRRQSYLVLTRSRQPRARARVALRSVGSGTGAHLLEWRPAPAGAGPAPPNVI